MTIIVLGRHIVQQLDFRVAAWAVIFSLFYTYFLVDNVAGQGTGAGNFWWSAQITNFLLSFVCARHYIKFVNDKARFYSTPLLIKYAPAGFGIFHVIAGTVWILSNLKLIQIDL